MLNAWDAVATIISDTKELVLEGPPLDDQDLVRGKAQAESALLRCREISARARLMVNREVRTAISAVHRGYEDLVEQMPESFPLTPAEVAFVHSEDAPDYDAFQAQVAMHRQLGLPEL